MPNGKRELRKRLRKLELEHAQLRGFVVKLNEETYKLDQRILALLFLIDAMIVHGGGGRRRFEAVFEEAASNLYSLGDKRRKMPGPHQFIKAARLVEQFRSMLLTQEDKP